MLAMDQTHSCKLRNVLVAGCADFCPNPTPNSSSKFEHLAPVVARARNWIQQNASLNVVNVQTIDYKLKSNHSSLSVYGFLQIFRLLTSVVRNLAYAFAS